MKITCFFFILISLVCCKKKNDGEISVTVGDFSRQIRIDSILSDVNLLKLNTPDSTFIGQIRDIAICNDSVYILDEIKQSLFIFDIRGNFIREVCYLGRAGGEYLRAFSLECDGHNVYVLDMTGKKLLKYDRLLNFVEQKELSYSSSDFKWVDGHFLLNNMEDVDGNYYFTYLDSDLEMVDQFIPYNRKWGHTLYGRGTGQMVAWNAAEKQITLVRPFSNEVYAFTPGRKLQPLYNIDFGRKTIPERTGGADTDISSFPFIYIEDFFDLGKYKVISFFEEDNRYYCIFTPEREVLYAGRIRDPETLLPFFPRWQYGKRLVGTCRGEYVKDYMKRKHRELNEEDLDKSYLIFYSL